MKTDADGYPTNCIVCGKPIVKKQSDSQHHFDDLTFTATSWHAECAMSSHLFFCKGKPAKAELVLGEWFCTVCGEPVPWVVAA